MDRVVVLALVGELAKAISAPGNNISDFSHAFARLINR